MQALSIFIPDFYHKLAFKPKNVITENLTNTLFLAPFRDPFAMVRYRGTTRSLWDGSAPRLSMICPLQGHYHRSKIEPCDQSVQQNRKVSPEPNDIFGIKL